MKAATIPHPFNPPIPEMSTEDRIFALLDAWKHRMDSREAEYKDLSFRSDKRGMSQCATELMEMRICYNELMDIYKDSQPKAAGEDIIPAFLKNR